MPGKKVKNPHPWKLNQAEKDALRLSLLDLMIEQDYQPAELEVDGLLLFEMLPYLSIYHDKWDEYQTQPELEEAECYQDMLKHVKAQFHGNGQALERKLELRREERSMENRSKAPKTTAKASPKNEIQEDLRKPKQSNTPSAKRQKVEEQ